MEPEQPTNSIKSSESIQNLIIQGTCTLALVAHFVDQFIESVDFGLNPDMILGLMVGKGASYTIGRSFAKGLGGKKGKKPESGDPPRFTEGEISVPNYTNNL